MAPTGPVMQAVKVRESLGHFKKFPGYLEKYWFSLKFTTMIRGELGVFGQAVRAATSVSPLPATIQGRDRQGSSHCGGAMPRP
jgi:hypothetical protein